VPNLAQLSYECTICYETFDEIDHRPLTLICDSQQEKCGHTYCLACIREISKIPETQKCPSCNASFKFTTTNWFVIDLIKTSSYDIDNPFLDVLVDDIESIELKLSQYKRNLMRVNKENEEHAQKMKSKIEVKIKEGHTQLKSIEYNLIVEYLNLKNNHEQTLNECKRFEALMEEKLTCWNKRLGSLEYRRDSTKLEK